MMKNSNRGRSKLFSCFKSVVVNDDSDDHRIKPSAVGEGGPNKPSDVDYFIVDRKSKSSRRFKRLLKSLLFDIPLPKRLRNRKSNKDDDAYESLKSYKFSDLKSSSFTGTSDSDDTLRINSTRSSSIFSASTNISSLLSSSDSSVSSSNSKFSTQRTGTGYFQDESPKNEIYCSTIILCLFLLCLLVLVCWGKFCAILCTSTCFFLCSRRSNELKSAAEYVESAVDINSKEYKKKIFMVGLLGRERSRLL